MDLPPCEILPDNITAFCRTVISRHSANWPPNENVLAQEIVDFFGIGPFLTLETLVQLCRDHLRIPVSFIELPTELRGYNCSYGNKREIVVSQHQTFPGADQHTLLHELREILEATFEGLGHPIVNRRELEGFAESFAISVQMAVAERELPNLFQNAAEIERKWWRITAYVLLGVGGLAYLLGCALRPYLEDVFASEELRQRNLHT